MSQNNFDNCLKKLLIHESGYINDSRDPGGMSNFGVTAKVWAEWVGHDVNEKIMKSLTPSDVAPLYKRKYWDACRADELVSGLDYAVFDYAVNSGVGRAAKTLQDCVGVTPDGGIGPATLAAVKTHNIAQLIENVCDKRLDFLKSLSTFPAFGRGWERRINEVKADALRMLG
jgi:lysozyme family protein